ncbi:Hpt domain-containing protein [Ferviditalea candida]|uniref:Hpt domain-containing protein n=1 Tax=Ferviditalea candida TaxID=3108399 RepID=A0ABU5ZJY9_9BACL|nr:Hpt domain-containing protein [Paenibacillaceae bacterium T2]
MDPMYIAYFEETEEFLQKAEGCLIKLETAYSADDINELFRIAHSIKGSSMMMGYDKIGNLTHKLEDMLDYVRKGKLQLDSQVFRLCFDGLDYVKKLFESKKAMLDEENDKDVVLAARKLEEEIDQLLRGISEEKNPDRKQSEPVSGIVSAMKEVEHEAKNRYFISVFFSDDAPMAQALLFMIFHNIKGIGSLLYSSVSDHDIFASSPDRSVTSCEMILNTEMEASELYPYFELTYVDKTVIIDISTNSLQNLAVPDTPNTFAFFEMFFNEFKKIYDVLFDDQTINSSELLTIIREQAAKIGNEAENASPHAVKWEIKRCCERCLLLLTGKTKLGNESRNMIRNEFMEMFEKVYRFVRGRLIFKIFKARNRNFKNQLSEIVERMDKTLVRKLLIDVSALNEWETSDLTFLIDLKRQLRGKGITIAVIAGVPLNKRLVNILDSIAPIERFSVFDTELNAALGDYAAEGRSNIWGGAAK